MATTLLEKLAGKVPSAHRRFLAKQGDLAMQIWDVLDRYGWTQRDLANRAGMKESFISRLLAGGGNPTLKTICAIEDALGEEVLVAPKFADYVQPASAIASTTIVYLAEDADPVFQSTGPSTLIHIEGGGQHQPDADYWVYKAAV